MHQLGDREHVVHDAAIETFLTLVELHVEAQRVLDPHGLRRARVGEPRGFARRQHQLARHVETHHLGRQLGAQHEVERLGIAPCVELGVRRRVARRSHVADHRDVALHLVAHQRRIAPQRQREARHRPERHQGDRLGLVREQPVERLDEVEDHPGRRDGRVAEPRFAVRLARHGERPGERAPRAHAQRGPLSRPSHDRDRVAVGVFDRGVAVRHRDPAHVELRRAERQEQRQHVVDAGVGIDQNGMREAGCGMRRLWHG